MKGKFLFLGTGSSMGIPVIGCDCRVCHSLHPQDKRLRSSGLLKLQGKQILIDCSPDFREQALRHRIRHLDGVLFTHAHHDHTSSIDELRIFYLRSGKAMPCLASKSTAADLKIRFDYIFGTEKKSGITPKINLSELPAERGTIDFESIIFKYFTYEQINMPVAGYRVGNFAYVTDIRQYPDTIFDDLSGVDVLIISALRFSPSPMHFTIDEAIDFSRRVGAKKTWLTHIAHEVQHEHVNAYLPPSIQAAYDGLEIDFLL